MKQTMKRKAAAALILLGCTGFLAGCGVGTAPRSSAVNVQVMKVIQRDTAVSYEYSGQVKSMDAVTIKPRVSGSITEKYFTSGQLVHAGDPLYKVDDRQYEAELLSARSGVDKAQVTLNNSMIDLARYQKLAATGAIPEQTLTTQQATVASNQSSYNDAVALMQKAQENLDDTVIRSPISGKLSVDDVSVGTYVTSGNTELVSVGSINPIYVQFSISENEYLDFLTAGHEDREEGIKPSAPLTSLTLSNGAKFPGTSNRYIVDRQLSASTGTLTIKAIFDNDQGMLLPGMFAKVTVEGEPQKDALLVPQRAVQQVLDKSFVIVVGENNQSVSKIVELGAQVGSFYIIKSGLSKDDRVVVEGLTNLKEGQALNVSETTPEKLGLSFTTEITTNQSANEQNSK